MTTSLSLQQILASLEAQMEIHREKEAHHAQEEVAHRQQREAHAAELAALARHYEALKSSAEAAEPLAARYDPEPLKESQQETLPPGKPVVLRRLVERLLGDTPMDEPFTPTSLAAAVNRRFRGLPRPADPRAMSTILRRLADDGWVRLAQKGTSHREATYVKV